MPFITDNIKLGDAFLKRSAKLIDCQRAMIHWHYGRGMSIHALAKLFKVNKRLIQFELFPERKAKNIADRKAKGGSKQYYKKEYHTEAIRNHRRYKYKALKDFVTHDRQQTTASPAN